MSRRPYTGSAVVFMAVRLKIYSVSEMTKTKIWSRTYKLYEKYYKDLF